MAWLEGVPATLGVVGAAVAAAAVALVVARVLRLDRWMARLGTTAGPGPAEQVEILAGLADVAHREGVLGLEARAAALNDDFLARGVALAVDGAPAEQIRSAMEAEIDGVGLGAGFPRSLLMRLARYPQAGVIAGAAALLAVMSVYGADPQLAGRAAIAGLGLFLVSVGVGAMVGPIADRLAGREAAMVMTRLLQTEAMVLIRTGNDGRTVAYRLRSMLPGGPAAAVPAARAA